MDNFAPVFDPHRFPEVILQGARTIQLGPAACDINRICTALLGVFFAGNLDPDESFANPLTALGFA